jgi:hypothetical protein
MDGGSAAIFTELTSAPFHGCIWVDSEPIEQCAVLVAFDPPKSSGVGCRWSAPMSLCSSPREGPAPHLCPRRWGALSRGRHHAEAVGAVET